MPKTLYMSIMLLLFFSSLSFMIFTITSESTYYKCIVRIHDKGIVMEVGMFVPRGTNPNIQIKGAIVSCRETTDWNG